MSRTIGLFRGVFINYFQNAYIEKFIKKGVFCPTVLVVKRFTYFFLGIGMDVGGLLIKYSSRSLMIYEIERSYFLESLSRKSFISSVALKFKGTDFMSLLIHTM